MRIFFSSSVLTIATFTALSAQATAAPLGAPSDEQRELSENLGSLKAAEAKLNPKPPLPVEKSEGAAYTREMIAVEWRDGDPIYLYLIKPKTVAKPRLIVYLYGYPAETDRYLDDGFCNVLVRNGYAGVGFVSALTGHRYHDRPLKEWFISELQESLVKSVHDVSLILDYLQTRKDLDLSQVGMFGEGSGGTIAILAASVEPRLKAIQVLDPWGDWPVWMADSTLVPNDERSDLLKPAFLKKVQWLDPIAILPALRLSIRYQTLTAPAATPQRARDAIQAALPAQADVVSAEKGLTEFKATNGAGLFDWLAGQLAATSPK